MVISLIVAMGSNRAIGVANNLPWRLPADLKHFKRTTMGKSLIMGRKTFETIGRPLPGRKNIILTRDPTYQAAGCFVVHSLESALEAAGDKEVMIIGGGQIYRLFLPIADRIYATLIDSEFEGDTFFPELDPENWRLAEHSQPMVDEQAEFSYSFLVYERQQ